MPKPIKFLSIINNEISEEFENRRRSSKAFLVDRSRDEQKRRRTRKLPFRLVTKGRLTNQPPFFRQLRQHTDLDHMRRYHGSWQKEIHDVSGHVTNQLSQKRDYPRKSVKKVKKNKLPLFPPQFPVFVRSHGTRFASTVRRMGNSYSSFFCGGRDCKSWGYSYRS